MNLTIRAAIEKDLAEIVEITNQAIRAKRVGFTKEMTVPERTAWFHDHGPEKYPILVADGNGAVIGWASISPYRQGREAFNKTAEISCFVHDRHQRQGVGTALLAEMISVSQRTGKSTIVAIIFHTNSGSARLLEKNGFELWGRMPKVGEIAGVLLDHLFYGKKV